MTFSDQYFRFQRNSIVLVENDKNENVFSRSTGKNRLLNEKRHVKNVDR